MQYGKLGRTGLEVSRLSLGAASFGLQTDEEAAIQILDKAADAGVNFIDTADTYPMNAGPSEYGRTDEIVGRWLHGKRDRFIIGAKIGGTRGPNLWDQGGSRKHVLDAIDLYLRRLQVEYVDLFSLHFDDRTTPLDETLEALDTVVRSGKARYIGVSNFLAYRLARALGRQDTLRLARFVCVQPRYNLISREFERELGPLAFEEGVGVTPFNPLAGGLLTGKYRSDETPKEGRFSAANGRFGKMYSDRYWQQREFEAIEAIAEVARQSGLALPTLAIAWVTANPVITSAVLGASKPEQLTETLAAADLVLDPDVKQRLDDLTAEF